MNRFKFRIPVYDNENKFVGFTKLDIEKGITPYNYGKVHHEEKEQCTGLKDKNGKLIYENDLIKIDDDDRIFQVVWLDNPLCWGIKYQKDTYALAFLQCSEKFVVGNIHENKELLEE